MNKAIYFKGNNCVVCQELFPKIKEHMETVYPQLEFEVIKTEDSPEVTAQYGVFTVPVLLIFFDGKEHFRFVRNFSVREVDEKLRRTYKLMFE